MTDPAAQGYRSAAVNVAKLTIRFLLPIVVAVALLMVIWILFLHTFSQVGPRVGKTPGDVYGYLFGGPKSAGARQAILGYLSVTLRDAAVGFTAGMAAAIGLATVFVLSRTIEHTFMPVAMLLRSVPLVVITPIIVLIFGRGALGVAAMASIVVAFPALAVIAAGLRESPRQAHDLIAAYGGSSWVAMRMVTLPSAVPSLFTAARISVPGALTGALIGEWLGSGQGLGSSLMKAISRYQYNELWASIAVVTVASIAVYALVGVLESLAVATFGPHAGINV
jgi:ABC-type nitrate/sulfonate/bicarbonate transport system permease component